MVELLIGGGVTLVVSVSTYLLGKRKTSSEIRKLEAESDKLEMDKKIDELEFFSKINKVLEDQNAKHETYIKSLEKRIIELETMVKNLHGKQCLGDNCPTKQDYDKIIAKREARKSVIRKKLDKQE